MILGEPNSALREERQNQRHEAFTWPSSRRPVLAASASHIRPEGSNGRCATKFRKDPACAERRRGLPRRHTGGRKGFLRAYEMRMDTLVTHPLFDYRVSYRRLLEIQARLLARVLDGEIAEYPVFTTR